jgi:hypothetical protein
MYWILIQTLFLIGVAHWSEGGDRLPVDDFIPWSEAELRDFLKDQCGLTKTRKVPGRFNTEHDGAFKFFSEFAEKSGTNLALTHVDAHADLGLGGPAWVYLLGELTR